MVVETVVVLVLLVGALVVLLVVLRVSWGRRGRSVSVCEDSGDGSSAKKDGKEKSLVKHFD